MNHLSNNNKTLEHENGNISTPISTKEVASHVSHVPTRRDFPHI